MNTAKLPPKKTFGTKSPEFINRRRVELQEYLRQVRSVCGSRAWGVAVQRHTTVCACGLTNEAVSVDGRRLRCTVPLQALTVDRITEFHTHHGSQELALFINYESRKLGMKQVRVRPGVNGMDW